MTSIKDIFILTILTILEIACSQLTSNPNDCGCLFTWQNDKLSANCSSRTSINYQCVAEKNPHKLDISKNNLEEFPEEFINNPFPNLEDFNAAQNKIEHVPKDLKHLFPNLKNVNLADNCLSDPTEVLNLKDVTCVLNNNPFICNCTDPSTQLLLRHAHNHKFKLPCKLKHFPFNTTLDNLCPAQGIQNEEHTKNVWDSWPFKFTLLVCMAIFIVAFIYCKRQ